jgi:hypothetical protein
VNNYNAGVCGPYLDSISENPEGGDIGPEFTGGQCAINYTVTIGIEEYPFDDCSTFGEGISSNGYLGPIRGLRFGVVSPSGTLCTPGRNRVWLQHGAPGNETLIGGAGYGVKARLISIVPEAGLPDNCGNPAPTYQPPATVTPDTPVPPGITVNLPGIGPVTVNITLDPSGDPVFTIPDIGVEFGVDLGGGDPGGGGGDPTDPTDPGNPGSPSNTGAGGVSEGEAPLGSELVGLLVSVLTAPEGANTFDNNAYTVFRGIGYVAMGFPGRLGVDISGGTVISPQFFHAQQRGLTSWAVRANVGFNLRVTPYYRSTAP